MHKIERKHPQPVGKKVYTVYTKEEADELGLKYKPWRDVELDDKGWVISDDGYVAEIIKISPMWSKNNPKLHSAVIVLPYARPIIHISPRRPIKKDLLFKQAWETKKFHSISEKSEWTKKLKKNRRWKWFANAHAIMTVNGYVDYSLLGQIVQPSHANPAIYARQKIYRNQQVKELCMEALADLLEKKGAGRERTISMILRAAELAENARNAKDLLAVARTLVELNAMEPKKITTMQQIEGDFEKMLDDGTVKGMLTGTKTTEEKGDNDG